MQTISINTAFLKLDQFLKFCGVAQTGGHAKELIAAGEVSVGETVCLKRGKKLYPQDVVTVAGEPEPFLLVAAE